MCDTHLIRATSCDILATWWCRRATRRAPQKPVRYRNWSEKKDHVSFNKSDKKNQFIIGIRPNREFRLLWILTTDRAGNPASRPGLDNIPLLPCRCQILFFLILRVKRNRSNAQFSISKSFKSLKETRQHQSRKFQLKMGGSKIAARFGGTQQDVKYKNYKTR